MDALEILFTEPRACPHSVNKKFHSCKCGQLTPFFCEKAVARKEACSRIAGLLCQLGTLSRITASPS
ncbi:hypothetical protein Lspi_0289 [Legionella spiritensis]|uniref:Uncharacterized protein n=1 Tax=Legionella spiritensis TaxID=452 RepID=A0A0W0ZA41_LEGSP|nr:hypothetical protein Lspi_0289 [Legionella spiritensis]SNV23532.1 Uncharacterised protein [Legionella spiritensis]